MLGRVLLVGLAALGLFFAWFFYTVRWSGQAHRAARNLANSYQLRVGMSAAEVRKLMGFADQVDPSATARKAMQAANQPSPARFVKDVTRWSYATPFASDGTVMVYLASDSTVSRVIYPKGESPTVSLKR